MVGCLWQRSTGRWSITIPNSARTRKLSCGRTKRLIPAEYVEWSRKCCALASLISLQNGFVELKEFEKIVQLLQKYDQISQVFEQLDTNDDHRISFQEFKKGFQLLNENAGSEDHLKQEFDSIDSNHGGSILFDEVTDWKVRRLTSSPFLVLHVHGQEESTQMNSCSILCLSFSSNLINITYSLRFHAFDTIRSCSTAWIELWDISISSTRCPSIVVSKPRNHGLYCQVWLVGRSASGKWISRWTWHVYRDLCWGIAGEWHCPSPGLAKSNKTRLHHWLLHGFCLTLISGHARDQLEITKLKIARKHILK